MTLNRKNMFRILAVLWMVLIFAFSARDADRSTADSHRAGRLVGTVLIRDFSEWSEPEKEAFAIRIDHPVRKCAHALEYALLAVLFLGALIPEGTSYRETGFYRLALAGCFLYACTDEIHQIFVPGRSCQPGDVLIDCTGALAGLLAAFFCLRFFRGKR